MSRKQSCRLLNMTSVIVKQKTVLSSVELAVTRFKSSHVVAMYIEGALSPFWSWQLAYTVFLLYK